MKTQQFNQNIIQSKDMISFQHNKYINGKSNSENKVGFQRTKIAKLLITKLQSIHFGKILKLLHKTDSLSKNIRTIDYNYGLNFLRKKY